MQKSETSTIILLNSEPLPSVSVIQRYKNATNVSSNNKACTKNEQALMSNAKLRFKLVMNQNCFKIAITVIRVAAETTPNCSQSDEMYNVENVPDTQARYVSKDPLLKYPGNSIVT